MFSQFCLTLLGSKLFSFSFFRPFHNAFTSLSVFKKPNSKYIILNNIPVSPVVWFLSSASLSRLRVFISSLHWALKRAHLYPLSITLLTLSLHQRPDREKPFSTLQSFRAQLIQSGWDRFMAPALGSQFSALTSWFVSVTLEVCQERCLLTPKAPEGGCYASSLALSCTALGKGPGKIGMFESRTSLCFKCILIIWFSSF